MHLILEHQTINTTAKYRTPKGKFTTFSVWGVFDGAQVEVQVATDDGTEDDYITASLMPDPEGNLVFSDKSTRNIEVSNAQWLVVIVTSAGASTDISASFTTV